MLIEYENLYGEIPKMNAIRDNPDFPSAQTFVNHFGSWNNALKAADMRLNSSHAMNYDEEDLIKRLIALDDRLERTPSYSEISYDVHTPSPSTYVRYFGSLSNAMKKAGLEVRPNNCAYSKEELLDKMLEAKIVFGYIPSSEEWKEKCEGFPTQATYHRRFNGRSWSEIVRLAEKYALTNKTVDEILEKED